MTATAFSGLTLCLNRPSSNSQANSQDNYVQPSNFNVMSTTASQQRLSVVCPFICSLRFRHNGILSPARLRPHYRSQPALASVTRTPWHLLDNTWGRDQPSRSNSCNFSQRPTCYYCGIPRYVFRSCRQRRDGMEFRSYKEPDRPLPQCYDT